jgi:hypothetical protein
VATFWTAAAGGLVGVLVSKDTSVGVANQRDLGSARQESPLNTDTITKLQPLNEASEIPHVLLLSCELWLRRTGDDEPKRCSPFPEKG